jgi:hypothetical protein
MSSNIFEDPALSGGHVRAGLFMACGPDIKKINEPLAGLRIYDITPTALHLSGVPVSDDMDGRVLTEILKDDSEPGQRKVVYGKASSNLEDTRQKIRKLKALHKL